MGSASSKFRKHLQTGDEVQALQLYRNNSELRKALDPNCSYGDSHQHETPLHLASLHGMQTLLGIFLFNKGGNPNKTNARKETCLHNVCKELNFQSVHVSKRRSECLGYMLKWRGATLEGGQLEKVDLAAQDEKLNTALHYAAASGLKQCVELLIQHGGPLFIENEDGLTPCDTAEKNGHSRIALYLESKMVFSSEEEQKPEGETSSMPPMEEFSGLRPQDLQEAKDQLLVETADMLSVPLFTAEALLRNHEWSRETLLEAWMSNPVICCEKCGVIPPSSLFSDQPEVQENLASPLPSPLHSSAMSLDTECEICTNVFPIVDEPVHMSCQHRFCKECWETYLNLKIQEGDAHHITCPAFDCGLLVPVDVIEGVVSRDMARRYLQFDIKAFVDSNPDMKWCPFPGCGRAVTLPDLDLGTKEHGNRTKIPPDSSRGVDCGSGHYFCWECLEESHEPCSCDNWSKWFLKIAEVKPETLSGTEQETELAASCLWLVTNSKPCPNCKSPIQKNEGCNHMKCSKCKHDFCWVCLEQWKRHNSSTGGYFKCNRYQVVQKIEEENAQLMTEAEEKNKHMQELNRFVHYYTRFRNHENSYKLEEPLLKTAKDKMMKLAEAVTDNATALTETKFVEDAVNQLLKARRVLKCSYVYGYYLDGPGYKKIVFEFMQTELEEATEILSQMVNRLYLRTPRRKIIDQACVVQRKRREFITAISKGLVPPETPPSTKKGKKKRRFSGEEQDEDLRKAILASIQEVDPSNPWIKDASGRHTNVLTLLEWPSDESGDSDYENKDKPDEIGRCRREGCNRLRCRNPQTKDLHDFCSRWCSIAEASDREDIRGPSMTEIALDEHMELLRALEMSRLQYMQETGLLQAPEHRQNEADKSTQTATKKSKHRPRSNSTGEEGKITPLEELDHEMRRFQELISAGDDEGATTSNKSNNSRHSRKLSQSSRFDELSSTIVTKVPNRSVEDLLGVESSRKVNNPSCLSSLPGIAAQNGENSATKSDILFSFEPSDWSNTDGHTGVDGPINPYSQSQSCASSTRGTGFMFGAIKDLSVSNILHKETDKTEDFLTKDLSAIFASLDKDIYNSKSTVNSQLKKVNNKSTGAGYSSKHVFKKTGKVNKSVDQQSESNTISEATGASDTISADNFGSGALELCCSTYQDELLTEKDEKEVDRFLACSTNLGLVNRINLENTETVLRDNAEDYKDVSIHELPTGQFCEALFNRTEDLKIDHPNQLLNEGYNTRKYNGRTMNEPPTEFPEPVFNRTLEDSNVNHPNQICLNEGYNTRECSERSMNEPPTSQYHESVLSSAEVSIINHPNQICLNKAFKDGTKTSPSSYSNAASFRAMTETCQRDCSNTGQNPAGECIEIENTAEMTASGYYSTGQNPADKCIEIENTAELSALPSPPSHSPSSSMSDLCALSSIQDVSVQSARDFDARKKEYTPKRSPTKKKASTNKEKSFFV